MPDIAHSRCPPDFAGQDTAQPHWSLANTAAAGADFFATPAWFANMTAACLSPDETAHTLEWKGLGLPLRIGPIRYGPLEGRQARGLSNFYSCRFGLTGAADIRVQQRALGHFGGALRRDGFARLRFDALDEPEAEAFQTGLQRAGWLVERFPQFGNWYLPCKGLGFAEYWQTRPGQLRSTGRRKQRALFQNHGARLHHFTRPGDAKAATAFYAGVAQRSWQPAEPFPAFLPGLIAYGLAGGTAEVWGLSIGGEPAAAQIWVRGGGRATIFKLAFDQRQSALSPGTVLTMAAMRHALEEHGDREIDFGWGDDPYKRQWLPLRRQRYGLAAYHPRTPAGLALAVRNFAPKAAKLPRRPKIPRWLFFRKNL